MIFDIRMIQIISICHNSAKNRLFVMKNVGHLGNGSHVEMNKLYLYPQRYISNAPAQYKIIFVKLGLCKSS